MFDFVKRWRDKRAKQVRINVVNALELKPDATYVLVADSRAVSRADIEDLVTTMQRSGIRNVVGFLLAGKPGDAVQIVERNKGTKHATKQTRHKH